MTTIKVSEVFVTCESVTEIQRTKILIVCGENRVMFLVVNEARGVLVIVLGPSHRIGE